MADLLRKRKFVVAMTALAFTFVLSISGHVEGSGWTTCVGLIVGLYGTQEAAEGIAAVRSRGDGS